MKNTREQLNKITDDALNYFAGYYEDDSTLKNELSEIMDRSIEPLKNIYAEEALDEYKKDREHELEEIKSRMEQKYIAEKSDLLSDIKMINQAILLIG